MFNHGNRILCFSIVFNHLKESSHYGIHQPNHLRFVLFIISLFFCLYHALCFYVIFWYLYMHRRTGLFPFHCTALTNNILFKHLLSANLKCLYLDILCLLLFKNGFRQNSFETGYDLPHVFLFSFHTTEIRYKTLNINIT